MKLRQEREEQEQEQAGQEGDGDQNIDEDGVGKEYDDEQEEVISVGVADIRPRCRSFPSRVERADHDEEEDPES